jgi:hypothetical protein
MVGHSKEKIMISVLNYKPFQRGSILGFFDLHYHWLVVKGCRLLIGQNGYWTAFPQKEGTDKDGKTQYFDQMYLTKPEASERDMPFVQPPLLRNEGRNHLTGVRDLSLIYDTRGDCRAY